MSDKTVEDTTSQPNYYAIIPASVRYCKELKPNAKLLYGEIAALVNFKGYCYASNKYFAELYDVKERSISDWISQLSSAGFVRVEYDPCNNMSRKIYIMEERKYSGKKKNAEPLEEKDVQNNIKDKNNYKDNTEETNGEKGFSLESPSLALDEGKTETYKRAIDIYEEECPSLSRARTITSKRKNALVAVLKTLGGGKVTPSSFEHWRLLCQKAEASDWIAGRVNGKKKSLSWLLERSDRGKGDWRWVSVYEGNYDRYSPSASKPEEPKATIDENYFLNLEDVSNG